MKQGWIVALAPLFALGVHAQDAPKPKGLTDVLAKTTKDLQESDMLAAEQAVDVLGSGSDPLQIARAHKLLTGTVNALRPQVESEPTVALGHLRRLEEQLVDASYAAEAGEKETQQVLNEVTALRKVAVRSAAAIQAGTRRKGTLRSGGGVRTARGSGSSTPPSSRAAPGSRVALLESQYSAIRALIAESETKGQDLLAGLVALDLRTTKLAQDYPADPGESEKLSLKLVEGEQLFSDLAAATYRHYKSQIEGNPAEAMVQFSAFLHGAPPSAKRAQRQGGLLLGAARRVWHKEHVARDLFKVDTQARYAALTQVSVRWREAIADERGHPLQEDLGRLERNLTAIERLLK